MVASPLLLSLPMRRMMRPILAAILIPVLATGAAADFKADPHNLSALQTSNEWDGMQDQTCFFCHPPNREGEEALWNRPVLNGQTVFLAGAQAALSSSPTQICLSCHDGSLARITELNHPVSIAYERARSSRLFSEYAVYDGSQIAVTNGIHTLPLYGNSQRTATVECASCHNMHDNTNGSYLRVNNARSALCLTCHIK